MLHHLSIIIKEEEITFLANIKLIIINSIFATKDEKTYNGKKNKWHKHLNHIDDNILVDRYLDDDITPFLKFEYLNIFFMIFLIIKVIKTLLYGMNFWIFKCLHSLSYT